MPRFYLQIIPVMSGMESRIESALSSSTVGQKAGEQVGKNLSAGVEKATVSAMRGAKFSQVFSASIRGNSQALGELGARANAAGQSIRGLAAKSLSLRAVRDSAAELAGSGGLGGVASLLGAGGAFGLAVAAGGFALNAFAEVQAEAKARVDALTDSLDAQTGKFTTKALAAVADSFNSKIDVGDLAIAGKTQEQILHALAVGGKEYADMLADIDHQLQNVFSDDVLPGHAAEQTTALNRIRNALTQTTEEVSKSRGEWALSAEQQRAVDTVTTMLTGDTSVLASTTQQATVVTQAYTTALANAAATSGQMVAGAQATEGALFGVEAQMEKVRDAINATPKNVQITAEGVGFSQLLAQIQAVQSALSVLKYGVDTTTPTYAGGDHTGLAADRQSESAKRAQREYEKAWNRVRKMQQDIDKHNVGVKTGTSTSGAGGSGGGSRGGGGGAATALMNARTDLLAAIGRGFAKSFIDSSPAQISKALADLSQKVKAALGGKVESQLVARVKKANDRLRPLARQRDAIADQLADATSNLANLRSSKASAVESVRANAIGSITERSWSAKGVAELLRRRLEHLRTFRVDLKTLAAKGLPQDFLNDLIMAGPEAAWKVARNLVTADAGTFADIKSKALALVSESTSFGKSAASMMYDAGIKTAEGLVKGFESQQDKIEAALVKIAKSMQKAIKKALGIKSPSSVFRDIGYQVPMGMVGGIDDGSPAVNAALGRMVNVPSIPSSVARSGLRQGRDAPLVGQIVVNSGDPVAVRAAVTDALVEATRTMQVAR